MNASEERYEFMLTELILSSFGIGFFVIGLVLDLLMEGFLLFFGLLSLTMFLISGGLFVSSKLRIDLFNRDESLRKFETIRDYDRLQNNLLVEISSYWTELRNIVKKLLKLISKLIYEFLKISYKRWKLGREYIPYVRWKTEEG